MKKIICTVIVFAFLANVSAQLKVNSAGQVGIGTASPQYKLDVNGDTRVTGGIYLGGSTAGLIAATGGVNVDEAGIYGLRYAEFVVPPVKAVQELSEQNEQLQTQINELRANDALRSVTVAESATGLQNTASSGASLQQNAPNPFSQTTQIKFYLPQSIKTASLNIHNLQGKQLKQITLSQRGEGSQVISGSEFAEGIYLYALIADGKKIDTKEMVLTEQEE